MKDSKTKGEESTHTFFTHTRLTAFFLSFVFSFHRTKAVKNDVRNEDAPKHNHALRSRQKRAHQAAEGAPRDSQGTGAERKRESERGLKERE